VRPARSWIAVALLGGLLINGCAKSDEDVQRITGSDQAVEVAQAVASKPDRAANAEAEVQGTTYADQGEPYGCTDDCSGHEAGYPWADDNDVTDPDDCGGDSQSFIEGCQAHAEAYQEALREADSEEEERPALRRYC